VENDHKKQRKHLLAGRWKKVRWIGHVQVKEGDQSDQSRGNPSSGSQGLEAVRHFVLGKKEEASKRESPAFRVRWESTG